MFYKLSHAGYEYIKTKITKLNRIARKLEQPEIQFELIKREVETDPKTLESKVAYHIMCIGEAPKLKDWKFMATIDFTPKGNIFNLTYDEKKSDSVLIPDRFRKTPFTLCEDCHVKRYRTTVFILFNEKNKKWMQVGSTCLGSFLGVNEREVHQLAEFATTLATMSNAIKKWDDKKSKSKKNNLYSGYKLVDMLSIMFGYVREEWEKNPYSWRLYNFIGHALRMSSYYFFTKHKTIKAKDKANAEAMIKYFETWKSPSTSNPKNQMFYDNVKIIMSNLVINRKHYKFLSFAFNTYNKIVEKKLYKVPAPVEYKVEHVAPKNFNVHTEAVAEIKKPSTYIGTVGEKIVDKLETTVILSKRGYRGTKIVLVDKDGRQLYWWCPYYYRVNDKITIYEAIIKNHKEYNGVKQTIITSVYFTKD